MPRVLIECGGIQSCRQCSWVSRPPFFAIRSRTIGRIPATDCWSFWPEFQFSSPSPADAPREFSLQSTLRNIEEIFGLSPEDFGVCPVFLATQKRKSVKPPIHGPIWAVIPDRYEGRLPKVKSRGHVYPLSYLPY